MQIPSPPINISAQQKAARQEKSIAHCASLFPTERSLERQKEPSRRPECCNWFNLQPDFSCAIGHRFARNYHVSQPKT
jgi:hypothetical protein